METDHQNVFMGAFPKLHRLFSGSSGTAGVGAYRSKVKIVFARLVVCFCSSNPNLFTYNFALEIIF